MQTNSLKSINMYTRNLLIFISPKSKEKVAVIQPGINQIVKLSK